jgi:hypothetical protein
MLHTLSRTSRVSVIFLRFYWSHGFTLWSPWLHFVFFVLFWSPISLQLEVLDTAGAEQFTSLNEVYIKVRGRGSSLVESANVDYSQAVGLFWYLGKLPVPKHKATSRLQHIRCSLTQEASLQEVDHLRKQIYRIKGGDAVSTRWS